MRLFKDRTFTPVDVMDATHDHLFARGGVGISKKMKSACVIGCGSFGGYLSELLMDYGVRDYLLIDYDRLSSDNVARHLCGFKYRGCGKTEAVRDVLRSHNPNIACKCFRDDVHEVLNGGIDELNKYDYIFLCVGDLGTEKRFFDLVANGLIKRPVVIIWCEPYCLACHAVILNNRHETFNLLYDSNMDFSDLVIKNSSSFFKREGGCQSTYIPYSSLMIKRFLIDLLYSLLADDRMDDDNYSFIWFGDLRRSNELHAIVADEFSGSRPFSFVVRKIS